MADLGQARHVLDLVTALTEPPNSYLEADFKPGRHAVALV